MESPDKQSNVTQICEPVHFAIKSIVENYKQLQNPDYIAICKAEIAETIKDLDKFALSLEMQYESEKRQIIANNPTAVEYEAAIMSIAREVGI